MSVKRLTASQQAAVDSYGKNIALSAGAGSGKTMVLVERYLNLLTRGEATVEDILAITFTRKAALEMRLKVSKELLKKSEEADNSGFWQKSLSNLPNATISTIHSFAQQILFQYPLESGVDPQAGLLDGVERMLLIKECLQEILTEKHSDPTVQSLVQNLKTSGELIKNLIKVYGTIRSLGKNFADLTSAARERYRLLQIEVTGYKTELYDVLEEIELIVDARRQEKDPPVYVIRFGEYDWRSIWERFAAADTQEDPQVQKDFKDLKFLLGPRIKDTKEVAEGAVAKLVRMMDFLAFQDAMPLYATVEEILIELHSRYSSRKIQDNVIDFADLEWGLRSLLEDYPHVLEELRKRFKYVFVDEFQDTNPLQQQLIRLLAPYEANSLFIVGDPRQSIYRFRAAELAGFIEMQNEISDCGGERMYLEKNFRSHKDLIDFQNALFPNLFQNTGVDYDPVYPGRDFAPDDKKRLFFALPTEQDEKKNNLDELRAAEARNMAATMKKLVADGYEYGDFTILMRAMTDADLYVNTLQAAGIPIRLSGSSGLLARQEVLDLFNLIRILANPEDNIARVGLWRSPFYGLSDRDILRIRRNLSSQKAEEAIRRAREIEQEWWKLRRRLSHESLATVLADFVADKHYAVILAGVPYYGNRALGNIRKFIDQIASLENRGVTGLAEIMLFLREMREEESLTGEAIDPAVDNAVKIMSIHQSKGLEFKIVFLPQLERDVDQGISDMVYYTLDSGLAVRIRGESDNPVKDIYFKEMQEKEKEAGYAESIRVFYVAVTRAEEAVYFSAAKRTKTESTYFNHLFEYLDRPQSDDEWQIHADNKGIQFNFFDESVFIKGRPVRTDKPAKLKSRLQVKKHYRLRPIVRQETGVEEKLQIDLHSAENLPTIIPAMPRRILERPLLSASALITYNICPLRYYYRYVQRYPVRSAPDSEFSPAQLGTAVHTVCELLTDPNAAEEMLKQVIGRLNKTPERETEYFAKGSKMLARYLDSYIFKYGLVVDKVLSEYQFGFLFDGHYINGVIDKIYFKDDSVILVDLKSGSMHEDADKYLIQGALYAWAVHEAYGVFPKSIFIYFFSDGQLKDFTEEIPDVAVCEKIIRENLNLWWHDLQKYEFQGNIDSCKFCDFQKICAYKRNHDLDKGKENKS